MNRNTYLIVALLAIGFGTFSGYGGYSGGHK